MSQNPGVGSSSGGSSSNPTYVTTIRTGQIASSPTFATVGTSSAQVLAANSNRTGAVLVNNSSNSIFFGIGANPAVVGSGIYLAPQGVWDMSEYDFTTQAINAISTGANSNLSIQEFT
jgi:hypothetical protein